MATMYPDAPVAGCNQGEVIVYNALKEYLPNDWMVFHSVWELHDFGRETETKLGENYASAESDFVVLVPDYGFVVIEVKNWRKVEIINGKWYHEVDGGMVPMKNGHRHSPLHQAQLASIALNNGLRGRNVIGKDDGVQYQCLAILLGCAKPPANKQNCEKDVNICGKDYVESRYICGEGNLKAELEKKILNAFVFETFPNNNKWMDAIRDDFCKNFRFGVDRRTYDHAMRDAGAQVTGLLELLEKSTANIRIDGCAGSGKTVMLCQEVRRLCDKAKKGGSPSPRILVLCYNAKLQERLLRKEFNRYEDDMVTSCTFHSFCAKVLGKKENPHLLDDSELEEVRHRLEAPDSAWHYDHVFIDEAQDFQDEWWDIVDLLPVPLAFSASGKLGKIYIFCDNNQMLYATGEEESVPCPPLRIQLKRNLRNAMEIAYASNELLPEDSAKPEPLPLSGGMVRVWEGGDLEYRKRAILEAIGFLTTPDRNNRGELPRIDAAPTDIVVLSPYFNSKKMESSIQNDLLAAAMPRPKGNKKPKKEVLELMRRCILPQGVSCSTIKSFKGLEADYVILTDIPAPGTKGFSRNDFYVACTRAKFGLIIIPTPEGEAVARQLLQATGSHAL